MRIRHAAEFMLVCAVSLSLASLAQWAVGQSTKDPTPQTDTASIRQLALAAVRGTEEQVPEIAARIRAQGPEGLAPLFVLRDELTARGDHVDARANGGDVRDDLNAVAEVLARLDRLIDQVAGQRYASISKLYWYTDLDEAERVAAETGKPILSLRLLGKLTEEYSCANSRFFRTTLYANEEISKRLGERFILHWSSERPAPRITIDYGDGRVVERTITGNSAHYLLAADGRPLDVLPGVYGPAQFLSWLDEMDSLYADYRSAAPDARNALLAKYHADEVRRIADQWQADLRSVLASNSNVAAGWRSLADAYAILQQPPRQTISATIRPESTTSIFAAVERCDITAFEEAPNDLLAALDQWSDMSADQTWGAIAALPDHSVALDRASQDIISQENPPARRASGLAISKMRVENPMFRMVANLQASIAVDSVKNEYTLHRKIHQWFAAGQAAPNFDELNARVYAELFLTPHTDPWLGMVPPDVYSGLERGGVSQTTR